MGSYITVNEKERVTFTHANSMGFLKSPVKETMIAATAERAAADRENVSILTKYRTLFIK